MRGISDLGLLSKRPADCLHSTRGTSNAGEIEHEYATACLLYAYQYITRLNRLQGFSCLAELGISGDLLSQTKHIY